MWARHPRNLAPAPFVRDVMRERSECPINPEIGNSYLLSDARPKSCKKRRRRVIDQYIHLPVYCKLLAASFCNVCSVYITIATTRASPIIGRASARSRTAEYLVGVRSAVSGVLDDYLRI